MVPQLFMSRVKFSKKNFQRKFLKQAITKVNSPSLREFCNRFNINYSTMKNYYSEKRLLPNVLFDDLRKISGIHVRVIEIQDNWGQIKGGKKSQR